MFLISTIFYSASAQKLNERYADSLTEVGMYDEAINVFNKLLKSKPKDEGLLRGKAYALMMKEDWNAAISEYRKIVALFPKCSKCFMNLAKSYAGKGRQDSALVFLDKAIMIDPENGEFYIERGRARMNNVRDSVMILQDLNRGIMLYPDVAEFYVLRARYYFMSNRWQDMLGDIESALKLDPENYDANFLAFLLLSVAGDNEGAVQGLQKSFQLRPNDPAVIAFIQIYRAGAGDTLGRKAVLDSLISSNKNNIVVRIANSIYFRVIGNFDSYCGSLNETYKKLKNSEDTALFNAFTYGSELICSPEYPEYYLNRVSIYRDSTQWNKAIELLKLGQQKFPKNSLIAFNLSWLYFKQKNMDDAYAQIQKSIGNYTKEEFFRASGVQDQNSAAALAVDRGFRFQQFMLLHESLLTIYQKSADKTGYGLLLQTSSDSLLALIPYVQEPQQRKKYFTNAAFGWYLLKNEEKLKKVIDESIKNSATSGTMYFFSALLQYEKAAPGTFEETGKVSDLYGRDHLFFIRLKGKNKKSDKIKLDKALSDINTAITSDPAVSYFYYLKGIIKFQTDDKSFCEDFKKAYEMGLDKNILTLPSKVCK